MTLHERLKVIALIMVGLFFSGVGAAYVNNNNNKITTRNISRVDMFNMLTWLIRTSVEKSVLYKTHIL